MNILDDINNLVLESEFGEDFYFFQEVIDILKDDTCEEDLLNVLEIYDNILFLERSRGGGNWKTPTSKIVKSIRSGSRTISTSARSGIDSSKRITASRRDAIAKSAIEAYLGDSIKAEPAKFSRALRIMDRIYDKLTRQDIGRREVLKDIYAGTRSAGRRYMHLNNSPGSSNDAAVVSTVTGVSMLPKDKQPNLSRRGFFKSMLGAAVVSPKVATASGKAVKKLATDIPRDLVKRINSPTLANPGGIIRSPYEREPHY
jgi:hypothetical protein